MLKESASVKWSVESPALVWVMQSARAQSIQKGSPSTGAVHPEGQSQKGSPSTGVQSKAIFSHPVVADVRARGARVWVGTRHLDELLWPPRAWRTACGDETERVEGCEDDDECNHPERDLEQRVVGDGGVRRDERSEDGEVQYKPSNK